MNSVIVELDKATYDYLQADKWLKDLETQRALLLQEFDSKHALHLEMYTKIKEEAKEKILQITTDRTNNFSTQTTISLANVKIRKRSTKRIVVADDSAAIAYLRSTGNGQFVRVKEEVDKSAIAKIDDISALAEAGITREENLTITIQEINNVTD